MCSRAVSPVENQALQALFANYSSLGEFLESNLDRHGCTGVNAGGYEAVMQHAVSRNNQKRASPSVDLILSEPAPKTDKKHAAGRGREALPLSVSPFSSRPASRNWIS